MASSMYDKLVDLLVDRFQVDRSEIKPGVTFEDLEMDSLFLVELLLVVQSELGVQISEDTASPRDTIERAAEVIEQQVAASATTSS
ncbi:MAG: phosphopantetheine-binding protein [Kibdelosporangium sp.]